MARVVRRVMSASARRAPSRAVRRARKHKVIMETITQEKKKLRSVICFEAQAPSGYTFIPAGNPLLTTSCKERCRKDGLQVYAVSTTPHMSTHNLSQHVHRIGYHFPSTVVAAACSELGLYLTSAGKAVPFHTLGALQENPPANSEVDQITINTEARDAIRDLFPNIPDNDINQIIKTAFQKGQRKVGTASELPLARRAQLAVVAHIRHLYTDYDRLLKQKSFHEARSEVEQVTLAKVIAWRGDDENGQTALEDVFREVIVISDDDDSETEEEEGLAPAGTRDHNVEILSSNSRTHEIQTQPISAVHVTTQDPLREQSEEAPPGFRIVTRVPARSAINRRGFNRYQAWNRALNRYRAEANGTQQVPIGGVTSGEKQSPQYGNRPVVVHEMPDPRRRQVPLSSMEIVPESRVLAVYAEKPGQRLLANPPTDPLAGKSHVGAQERRPPLEPQPMVAQYESRGRPPPPLTTQKPHEIRHLEVRPYPAANTGYSQGISYPNTSTHARSERFPISLNNGSNAPVFVSGPQELHLNRESQFGHRTDLHSPFHPRTAPSREDAIPSIELMDSSSLAEKRHADGRLVHLTNRMSLRSVTPGHSQGETSRHAHAVAPDSPDDQSSKRRRLAHHAASAVNPRLNDWNTRPIGNPIPEGRGPYRRDEIVLPEPHSSDRFHLRREPPPPAEQPLAIGHPRQRNPAHLVPSQATSNAGPPLDRTHIADPYGPVPMHTQSGHPGYSGTVTSSDRTIGPPTDATYAQVRPAYYDDRSPRLDRVWPTKPEEQRLPVWTSYADAGHSVVHSAPSNGKLYADDFVRPVDYREARPAPVVYHVPRPRHQHIPRVEEDRGHPARARISDPHTCQDLPHSQGPPETRHPRSPRVALVSHDQAPRHLNAGSSPRESHSKPSGASRDRRPGSGLGAPRRVHDPRSFQMVEQNRPIYVQRVESHPPSQYAVPDGRPIVIVD
ncbi:uncharacterized protein N7473_011622 [Penicillium subrubescens]|uniref:uncharacterized protein n=1 Tax=Penicillium subrubescens TaxID=1316194 RepID=UPI0025458EC6|nr:uncharacterized protein N7473_011622 [Penicillium subrubescens]KAJ5880569.1 hypothetical protein N7473_011622 [Penicillium subrubescens]